VEFIPISRTVDGERLLDELVIRFTHSETISHLLPGVAPTGRRVGMALVVIVGVRDGLIGHQGARETHAGFLGELFHDGLAPHTLNSGGAQMADVIGSIRPDGGECIGIPSQELVACRVERIRDL
jgi:hypothetical protein